MECWKRGRQSFLLPQRPKIISWASVAGKLEAQGPLGDLIDYTAQDTYFGQKTWEQAEQQMQMLALRILTTKARLRRQDLDVVLSGDLLNQCIGSTFGLANQGIPHLGLYGACSTMAESLLLASVLVGSGAVNRAAAMTSSHFASSERQYRLLRSSGPCIGSESADFRLGPGPAGSPPRPGSGPRSPRNPKHRQNRWPPDPQSGSAAPL